MTSSYFVCVFSERKREELDVDLMTAEWNPGTGTAKRRTQRKSGSLEEEEEEHGSHLCADLLAVPFLLPSEHLSTT